MYYQIQIRRGTASEWTAANSILAAGEIAFESDTNKMKVGNGSTAWTSLAYSTVTPTQLNLKADLASPTFTGTVTLPSTTSIGNVSSTEIGYVDGVTSAIQTQLDSKLTATTAITSGRNRIINGNMNVWQRGTSFTNPGAGGTYTADRWNTYFNGNGTVTQETTTVPVGSKFAIKLTSTSTNGGIASYQLIEDVNVYPLQNKTVVLSLQAAGTTAIGVRLAYSNTANDTLTNTSTQLTATTIANPTISTSLQTYIFSFSVPSTAKTLRVGIETGSVVNGNYIIFGNVQLEAGSVATPFEFEDYQVTLAKCQRYFQKSYNQEITPPTNGQQPGIVVGGTTSIANNALIGVARFPVSMRITPTMTIYSYTTSQLSRVSDAYTGTDQSTGTITVAYQGQNGFSIYNTSGVTLTSSLGQMFHFTASAEL